MAGSLLHHQAPARRRGALHRTETDDCAEPQRDPRGRRCPGGGGGGVGKSAEQLAAGKLHAAHALPHRAVVLQRLPQIREGAGQVDFQQVRRRPGADVRREPRHPAESRLQPAARLRLLQRDRHLPDLPRPERLPEGEAAIYGGHGTPLLHRHGRLPGLHAPHHPHHGAGTPPFAHQPGRAVQRDRPGRGAHPHQHPAPQRGVLLLPPRLLDLPG